MTDTDLRFERDLREILDEMAPVDAPAGLRFYVADVVNRPSRRRSPFGWSWRAWATLAAATVGTILVLGIGAGMPLLMGLPWNLPAIGGPFATPTMPTSIHGVWINYAVMPVGGRTPGRADIQALSKVMLTRLRAMGVDMNTASIQGVLPDRVTADLGLVDGDQETIDAFRKVLGTTGRIDFVPLGSTSVEAGQPVDLTTFPPLFSGEGVAVATIGQNQDGLRTVDLTLDQAASALLAAYTRDHVGEYFAIVADGVALSVPVIQSSIESGRVQITGAGEGGFPLDEARVLVAVIESGPLPFPVQELSVVNR